MDPLDRIDPALCVACKAARGLCGIDPCPLLQRVKSHLPQTVAKSKDLWGSSPPSLFVGRHGHPNVSVGPMLPPEHLSIERATLLDAPRQWAEMQVADIVGLRSGLLRTVHKTKVDAPPDRITRLSQELAIAARPVDTEVHLDRIPRFTVNVGEFTAPHGPTVKVERALLGENVRVERPVERVTSDTDLLASDGVDELMRAGTDLYQVERILSAGMLGRQRRLVPTRWAITATDDIAGKHLIDDLRGRPTIDKPTVHSGERLGNRFHVLLLPRVWGYELVEAWLKGAFWAQGGPVVARDHEDHRGRTAYASETTGGYYAARLAVLEHLHRLRRQATAFVLREVDDRYTTPLGVWVVREAARRAMENKSLVFEDAASAMRHLDRVARIPWRPHAEHLQDVQAQRSLDEY